MSATASWPSLRPPGAVGRAAFLSGIVMTVTLAVFFGGVHLLLGLQAGGAADAAAQRAIERVDGIYTGRARIASEVARLPYAPCGPADILALKDIASRAMLVRDVGRLLKGRIACSAVRGSILPLVLPPAHHIRRDARIWQGLDLPGLPYGDSNIIAVGDVFVVSSPTSYAGLDFPPGGQLVVATRDRRFTYVALPAQQSGVSRGGRVERFACSRLTDACAFVALPRMTLLNVSAPALLLLISAGILISWIGGVTLFRRARRQQATVAQMLYDAIEEGEIKLTYQPLRRVIDGHLAGFEVLSRWRPASGGEVMPDVFIPAAAQLNLSPIIFRYVLTTALGELHDAMKADQQLYIAVNAEPQDIAEKGMADFIVRTVRKAGLRASQVHIELTERDRICERAQRSMQALRAAGFILVLDDFGVGEANFSQFAKAQFGGVKIDKVLWSFAAGQPLLSSVLPGMCQIAGELDLEIVVEGVEHQAQADLLRTIAPGIIGQGWYFGAPVPGEDARALCRLTTATITS